MKLNLFKSTKGFANWWKNRKVNWQTDYFDTWQHPHRNIITMTLKSLDWSSLFELGVGGGANFRNMLSAGIKVGDKIEPAFKDIQLGGIDVNPEAIEFCKKVFNGGVFKVGSVEDLMMSDKSTDVILSDMTLIYVSPLRIKKSIKEIKRVTRKYILLCEFHSDSFWKRLKLKFTSGYNAYNYKKLLKEEGFYDISMYKLKEQDWPGGNPQKDYAYFILAKVPRR